MVFPFWRQKSPDVVVTGQKKSVASGSEGGMMRQDGEWRAVGKVRGVVGPKGVGVPATQGSSRERVAGVRGSGCWDQRDLE